jgi:hypothetical protein
MLPCKVAARTKRMSKQTKATLDPVEIEQLISVYHSELRQLNYRVLSVRKNIEQLETALAKQTPTKRQSVVSAPAVVAKPTVPVQPAPVVTTSTPTSTSTSRSGNAPKKVAMPKPVQVKRRRKLSPWDQFIIDTLENKDRVLIMSEFLDIVTKDFAGAQGLSETKIKSKLNAVFHKLANKKGNIIKVSFEGRGFAYALPQWLNSAGELKKKYRRK